MMGFSSIDDLGLSEDSSAKGKAEAALLDLIRQYPDAAKYLGPGALPYLQKLMAQLVDQKTSSAVKSVYSGLGGQ